MAGEKLAQYLINMNNSGISSNFLHGVVTNDKPVKIKVEGLPELKENQLILSCNVKKQTIKIKPHKHEINGEETSEELEEITLQEDLKTGDKVFIIQSNDRQKFYIMEVVEDDTRKKKN